MPTSSTIDLLELPDSADMRAFRAAIGDRLKTWVCYCSLYGDCWESRSDAYQPSPVKVCRDDPARRFME